MSHKVYSTSTYIFSALLKIKAKFCDALKRGIKKPLVNFFPIISFISFVDLSCFEATG